jgi:tetratricopeptide (TPR) repeat protein
MADILYWGEQGQYGPFSVQEDGWPNAGEVQRHFRLLRKLTPEAFGAEYSEGLKKLGKQNKKGKSGLDQKITASWVLNMEKQNRVPTDIERRRLISQILQIPPILLGLASVENVQINTQASVLSVPTPILHRITTDIDVYQKNIRVALQVHRTGSAQDLLTSLLSDIRDLRSVERQAKGDLLYHVRELLLSNHMLVANIVLDKRNYALATSYTDDAVKISQAMEDEELLARALCARGYVTMTWGLFGVNKQGIFQVDRVKVQSAIEDFMQALTYERIHPQLQGNIKLHLSRALGTLTATYQGSQITQVLLLADEVETTVASEPIDDIYIRTLVTGTASGLHKGSYLLGRATTFNAVGLPGKALKELNDAKDLMAKTYGRDETRKYVWSDIVTAETFMGLGEFGEASIIAEKAFIVCQDLNLLTNIMILTDIYNRLVAIDKAIPGLKEFGDLPRNWYNTKGSKP